MLRVLGLATTHDVFVTVLGATAPCMHYMFMKGVPIEMSENMTVAFPFQPAGFFLFLVSTIGEMVIAYCVMRLHLREMNDSWDAWTPDFREAYEADPMYFSGATYQPKHARRGLEHGADADQIAEDHAGALEAALGDDEDDVNDDDDVAGDDAVSSAAASAGANSRSTARATGGNDDVPQRRRDSEVLGGGAAMIRDGHNVPVGSAARPIA